MKKFSLMTKASEKIRLYEQPFYITVIWENYTSLIQMYLKASIFFVHVCGVNSSLAIDIRSVWIANYISHRMPLVTPQTWMGLLTTSCVEGISFLYEDKDKEWIDGLSCRDYMFWIISPLETLVTSKCHPLFKSIHCLLKLIQCFQCFQCWASSYENQLLLFIK